MMSFDTLCGFASTSTSASPRPLGLACVRLGTQTTFEEAFSKHHVCLTKTGALERCEGHIRLFAEAFDGLVTTCFEGARGARASSVREHGTSETDMSLAMRRRLKSCLHVCLHANVLLRSCRR